MKRTKLDDLMVRSPKTRKMVKIKTLRDWIIEEFEYKTVSRIARQIGITDQQLRYRLDAWRDAGLHNGKNKNKDNPGKRAGLEPFKEAIIDLYLVELMSPEEIAEKFEVSRPLIYLALRDWGINRRATMPAAICEKNRDEMIRRLEDGELIQDIAADYDVSRGVFYVHRMKWIEQGLLRSDYKKRKAA